MSDRIIIIIILYYIKELLDFEKKRVSNEKLLNKRTSDNYMNVYIIFMFELINSIELIDLNT